MRWSIGTTNRKARRLAREREIAEMENRNRDVRAKVDRIKIILDEITERKRGQNDR